MSTPRTPPERILLWAPSDAGHHRRWLEAIVAELPGDCQVVSPKWFSDAAESFDATDGSISDLMDVVNQQGPFSAVYMADCHQLVRPLAISRWPKETRLAAFDMRGHLSALHPSFRGRVPWRRKAAAIVDLVAKELVVRRFEVRFLYLTPWAQRVGSDRLRAATNYVPDPVERLETVLAEPSVCGSVLAMTGSFRPTKGLDLFVEALEQCSTEGALPEDITIITAGKSASGYLDQRNALVRRLRKLPYRVIDVDRHLDEDEISGLLHRRVIQVLPYRNELGMSGILGSAIAVGDVRCVVSDFGWLGRTASAAGADTFADGEPASLAAAIRNAVDSDTSTLVFPADGYVEPEEFGSRVAQVIVGGS